MKLNLSIIFILLILCTINPLSAEVGKVQLKNRHVPKSFSIRQPEVKRYKGKIGILNVYSRGFYQGDACYLEFLPDGDYDLESIIVEYIFMLDDGEESYQVMLESEEWGYWGIFPIHPETLPGKQLIRFYYTIQGHERINDLSFTILNRKFETSKSVLTFKNYNTGKPLSDKTKKYIQECTKKKKLAFNRISSPVLDRNMSHPRGMHYITSSFWKTRKYIRYKRENGQKIRLEDSIKIHRGLDLRGKRGTPVYAMARGRVVIAEKMYYEGNMVVLDHGNGIFSYYMHLNSINTREGQLVPSGTKIGTVGSTGRSTAPHLHVSFQMRGIQVDPLSVLSLPLR